MLRQSAQQLNERAAELRRLGEQVWQAAARAPSYDGQFGPKVRALAEEGRAQLETQAARLGSLSEELLARAEAFEAADLETQTAFQQLSSALQTWFRNASFLAPFVRLGELVGLENLTGTSDRNVGSGEDGEEPPWWAPFAIGAANMWHGFEQHIGQPLREALLRAPDTWRDIGEGAGTIGLYYTAQGWFWYDRSVNQPVRDAYVDATRPLYQLYGRLFAFQGPGLPADGPVTLSLTAMSRTDSSGIPLSLVGSELVGLVDGIGTRVAFLEGLNSEVSGGVGSGVAPWAAQIAIPAEYISTGQISGGTPVAETARVGLVAHELTHALQRQLDDPLYWPDGKSPSILQLDHANPSLSPLALARPIGDSTNHMEVVAYIVGETVQYDLLQAELANPAMDQLDRARINTMMRQIEEDLATYTAPDSLNANRWMMRRHPGSFFYQWNHFTESLLPGNRVPSGGWEESMRDVGFSDAAVSHIQGIASLGTPQVVAPGEIGLLGDIRTPTPTTTPTPTSTPSSSPSSSPTATPMVSPTPTASPTLTASASLTPTPTSTETPTGNP